MTAAKRFTDEERAELAELVRAAIRAELGRGKQVDAPKAPAVRPQARPEDYEYVRRLRRRKGLDE